MKTYNAGCTIITTDNWMLEEHYKQLLEDSIPEEIDLYSELWNDGETVTNDALTIEDNICKYLRDNKGFDILVNGHDESALIAGVYYDDSLREYVEDRHIDVDDWDTKRIDDDWVYEGVSELGKQIFDAYIEFFDVEVDDE